MRELLAVEQVEEQGGGFRTSTVTGTSRVETTGADRQDQEPGHESTRTHARTSAAVGVTRCRGSPGARGGGTVGCPSVTVGCILVTVGCLSVTTGAAGSDGRYFCRSTGGHT